MARPSQYTYSDAGFNGFFLRTLNSNPHASTLRTGRGRNQQLRFDDLQTSGMLGDKFKVGRITINGTDGRLEIEDESGTEVGRIGNLED